VRDSGVGVPPELLAELFTPFVTTKRHGVGIGLAIVQRIVQAHDGRISADANPGGGAIFTVRLPVQGTVRPDTGPRDDHGEQPTVNLIDAE